MGDDPLIPVVGPSPQTLAMSLSSALRQAAVDVPKDLPQGIHLSAKATTEEARVVVTVRAKNLYGAVVWEQRYDGRGKALQVGLGLTW